VMAEREENCRAGARRSVRLRACMVSEVRVLVRHALSGL